MLDHSKLPSIARARLPQKYLIAQIAIAEANRIDECKSWSDKAMALASYARQAKDDQMMRMAVRIQGRAISRCGELLKEVERAQGANQNIEEGGRPKVQTRKSAAMEAGLSEFQAKQALRIASIPRDEFEKLVESDNPPTVTQLAKMGTQKRKAVPVFEKRGMSKEAFQAGMYFRGELRELAEETAKYDPQLIVDGSMPDEQEDMQNWIGTIEGFLARLKSKLRTGAELSNPSKLEKESINHG